MKVASHTDNNFTPFRLLLALLVVLGHFQAFVGVNSPAWPYNYAATAVDCFFVVSGYLVSTSFDRDPNLYRFYIRRLFRIYPLYLAVIVAQALILATIEPSGFVANVPSMLRYLFFNAIFANFVQHDIGSGVLSGLVDPSLNASLWTLKIEFGFYLILPFLWRLVERFGAMLVVGIFVASAIYYNALWYSGHYDFAKQLPGQLQYFVLGVAAYRYRDRISLSRTAGLVLTIALAALVTALQRSHPPVIFPLAIAALVVVATLYAPRLRMETDISYGVYLLHAPTIQLSLLFGLYRPGWIGALIITAIVVALSLIVERLIERPGIALGRRLSRRGKSPANPPAPRPERTVVATDVELANMNIVVLNDFCYVQGGASKVAIDEAISLSKAGANVIFIGAVGPPCADLLQAPLRVECLNQHELLSVARHPAVALQGIWNLKAARATRAILETLPRDRTIVHLHGYTKALTTSPIRIARRLGFKVVCTLHDFFAACPNGAFFDYVSGKPCERRALSASCIVRQCDKRNYGHKLFRVVRGTVQRYRGQFPIAVSDYISLSRRSAAVLAPYLPREARLHPLQNVIDVASDPPADVARNQNILCVGRLDQEKGVLLIAEQAIQLGLPIIFVGDGPLREQIEQIPGSVVTGWIPAERVQLYLNAARCLIFPSLWYETYGLVVSEAAARGIPAIVSDISAAAERIEDGVTGWVFRNGDGADLARCLRLIESDNLVGEAGRAAYRAFWANAETRDTHAGNLATIYRRAMRGSAA
jgi:peptidoglycan/LPS O-acetylase OafA/YrhL/glycosyltransferase involved in cell wall biosynthesis